MTDEPTFTDARGRHWPAGLEDAAAQVDPDLGCIVAVGPGWRHLIADLVAGLAAKTPGSRLVSCERDAEGALGLEVAWGEGPADARLVKRYRSRSFLVCERCGAAARLRHDRPLLSVLCDRHAAARDAHGRLAPDDGTTLMRRLLGRR